MIKLFKKCLKICDHEWETQKYGGMINGYFYRGVCKKCGKIHISGKTESK